VNWVHGGRDDQGRALVFESTMDRFLISKPLIERWTMWFKRSKQYRGFQYGLLIRRMMAPEVFDRMVVIGGEREGGTID
jgi:hypothetical protein